MIKRNKNKYTYSIIDRQPPKYYEVWLSYIENRSLSGSTERKGKTQKEIAAELGIQQSSLSEAFKACAEYRLKLALNDGTFFIDNFALESEQLGHENSEELILDAISQLSTGNEYYRQQALKKLIQLIMARAPMMTDKQLNAAIASINRSFS